MNQTPLFSFRPAQYGGKASSSDYNRTNDEVYYDLYRLFQDTGGLKELLQVIERNSALENQFLQLRLTRLEHEMLDVIDQLQAHELRHGEVRLTLWPAQMIAPAAPVPGTQLSTYYGQASLPLAADPVTKLTLRDSVTGEVVIPRALDLQVTPEADGVMVKDSDWRSAVDGRPETAFVRSVRIAATDATSSATCQVAIGLPDSIISSRDVNMITIHPYPLGAVDVVSVEWRLSGEYQAVPGFTEVLDAGPLRLSFPTKQVAELRVTLRQRHAIETTGEKTFHMGIQHIEAADSRYTADSGSFDLLVDVPGTGLREITALEPVLQTAHADQTPDKRSLVTFQVFAIDDQGVERYTRDQLPIIVSTERVRLRATLHRDRDSGISPVLNAVRVTCRPGLSD